MPISHQISVPANNSTYTANFTTQNFLTMTAGVGGAVSPQGGWFDTGTPVQISATPSSGNTFGGWSGNGAGNYSGQNNPATVTMNGPVTETASFGACGYTLAAPVPQTFSASGGNGIASITTGQGCPWTATTDSPSWITFTTASGTGSGQIAFSVGQNPNSARSATISAGGQSVTLNQTAADNPVPSISNLSQTTAAKGGTGFTLTVNGSNFFNGSVVRWNGQNRQTTFVSHYRLSMQL